MSAGAASYQPTPRHAHPYMSCLLLYNSFGRYAHEIWETIRSNKDLNLPSQREMLATFRCDEIIKGIYEQMADKVKGLQSNVCITTIND
jgi:hypothetical protein